MSTSNPSWTTALGDPTLWRDLAHTVRRRIDHVEVEDIVQSTLTDALAAKTEPTGQDAVRRFVFAIARQKIADVYRRREREQRRVLPEPAPNVPPSPELGQWVDRTLPASETTRQTFEWMLREADGETLAEIAATEHVPPAMVRQRVSRLRRWLRARWTKEVAALSALATMAIAFTLALHAARPVAKDERRIVPEAPNARPPLEESPSRPTMEIPPELRDRLPMPRKARPKPPVLGPTTTPLPRVPSKQGGPMVTLRRRKNRQTTSTWSATFGVNPETCRTSSTPHGQSHVSITFAPDGSVKKARVVSGSAVDLPEARCLERLFSEVRTEPFEGGSLTGDAFPFIVPEPPPVPGPPAWLRAVQEEPKP